MRQATPAMKTANIGATITAIRDLTAKERAEAPLFKRMPKHAQVIELSNGGRLFADGLFVVTYQF